MRQSIKNFLIRISGNAQFQRLLERNVAYSLYLMGIGSGTFPYSSGEKALGGQTQTTCGRRQATSVRVRRRGK